jgi:hypothetical protein
VLPDGLTLLVNAKPVKLLKILLQVWPAAFITLVARYGCNRQRLNCSLIRELPPALAFRALLLLCGLSAAAGPGLPD